MNAALQALGRGFSIRGAQDAGRPSIAREGPVAELVETGLVEEPPEAGRQSWRRFADLMDASAEDALACMAFPKAH